MGHVCVSSSALCIGQYRVQGILQLGLQTMLLPELQIRNKSFKMARGDTMIIRARVESMVVAYCHYCGYVTAHKRRGNRCEVDSAIRVGKVLVSSKVLRLNYLISKLSFQLPFEETMLEEDPHTKTTFQRKYLKL